MEKTYLSLGGSIEQKLKNDQSVIPYRKRLNRITGDPKASILLQQCIFWAKISNWRAFYKFVEPCSHTLYKSGDSWTEQLGFSVSEFSTALKRISTKITKGAKKREILVRADPKSLIIYWTNSDRVTYFQVNLPLLDNLLNSVYLESTSSTDILNKDYTETINNRSSSEECVKKHLNYKNRAVYYSEDSPYSLSSEIETVIHYYYGAYEKNCGKLHPLLKQSQTNKVASSIQQFGAKNRLDMDEWKMIIDRWFNGGVKKEKTDFNINHFATNGILEILLREVLI